MRIVAGQFRGRPLAAPEGTHTRPTSDRVREAVFNILEHGSAGFSFAHVRVLDLFAGTGALGLEALSRGAAFCLFVEEDVAARGLIRRNIETLGVTGTTKVFRRDATNLGPAGNRSGGFGLAFLDPPYEQGLAQRALASAAPGRLARPRGHRGHRGEPARRRGLAAGLRGPGAAHLGRHPGRLRALHCGGAGGAVGLGGEGPFLARAGSGSRCGAGRGASGPTADGLRLARMQLFRQRNSWPWQRSRLLVDL